MTPEELKWWRSAPIPFSALDGTEFLIGPPDPSITSSTIRLDKMKIEIDTREAEEKFRAFAKMASALVVDLEAEVDALLAKIDIAKTAVGSLQETTKDAPHSP